MKNHCVVLFIRRLAVYQTRITVLLISTYIRHSETCKKNKACFSLFIVVSSHQGQSTAAVSRHDSGTSNIIRSLKVIKNYFLLVVTLTERKLL